MLSSAFTGSDDLLIGRTINKKIQKPTLEMILPNIYVKIIINIEYIKSVAAKTL